MLLIYMLTGFALSLLSVPAITSLAERANIVDKPSERKIHNKDIPLLGGLGIFLSYIIVVILIDSFSTKMLALIGANTIIIVTGVIDDVYNLKATKKLIGQFAAASAIVLFTDLRFSISGLDIALLSYPAVTIFLTYLWIVGVTNALNLIDGMDGLAGGIAVMAFGAIGYAAYTKGFEVNAFICMGLMGATLGFLRYNIPPAKVFMGDTGSLFLGFNIAVMSIAASHKSGTMLSVLIPVMFISLPLFDTSLAVIRRLIKGQNPMKADKEHLHHRLLDLEFSAVQTLMIFYSVSIALMAVSIFSFQQQLIWGAILVFLLLYTFLLALKLSKKHDIASKIRSINANMRKAARNISKKNEEADIQTRSLDLIIAIVTLFIFIRFIWNHIPQTYPELIATLMCLIIAAIVLTYRNMFQIKNEFSPFVFFWLFFHIVFTTQQSGFQTADIACFFIIFLCIATKIVLKRQFDLFISNPMELITLFCMMIIYFISKCSFLEYLLVSALSLMFYYSNKSFITTNTRFNNRYTFALCSLVFLFVMSGVTSVIHSDGAHITVRLTPGQIKTSLKEAVREEDYAAGRSLLVAYEQKMPLDIFKTTYQGEGAKIYYNLIISSLMKGDLDQSDIFLREFLNMFPDLAYSFYNAFEPVITNLSGLNVKGAENLYVHNVPVDMIINRYAATIKEMAVGFASEGYDKKSRAYYEVASLMTNLIR